MNLDIGINHTRTECKGVDIGDRSVDRVVRDIPQLIALCHGSGQRAH